jgi:hypothetical protein
MLSLVEHQRSRSESIAGTTAVLDRIFSAKRLGNTRHRTGEAFEDFKYCNGLEIGYRIRGRGESTSEQVLGGGPVPMKSNPFSRMSRTSSPVHLLNPRTCPLPSKKAPIPAFAIWADTTFSIAMLGLCSGPERRPLRGQNGSGV